MGAVEDSEPGQVSLQTLSNRTAYVNQLRDKIEQQRESVAKSQQRTEKKRLDFVQASNVPCYTYGKNGDCQAKCNGCPEGASCSVGGRGQLRRGMESNSGGKASYSKSAIVLVPDLCEGVAS